MRAKMIKSGTPSNAVHPKKDEKKEGHAGLNACPLAPDPTRASQKKTKPDVDKMSTLSVLLIAQIYVQLYLRGFFNEKKKCF